MLTGQTSNLPLPAKQLSVLMEGVKNYLVFLSEIGVTGFDCSEKSLETITSWGKKKVFLKETLENISTDLGQCRRCSLCSHRKNIVFGSGNPNASLVLLAKGLDMMRMYRERHLWVKQAGF